MTGTPSFRTDGGATWLNLLATRGRTFGTHPVERLPDPDAVRRWLQLVGLTPDGVVTEDDHTHVLMLREALRELAMAAVEGRPSDAAAAGVVDARAADPRPGLSAGAESLPVRAALAAIATQALVTLRGPDRALLRECAEIDCRWVFLDPSGRRRWCPAPACASRGRVRAHRAKALAQDPCAVPPEALRDTAGVGTMDEGRRPPSSDGLRGVTAV